MSRRAAIVSGASGGIGFALAQMLAEEGMAVTLVSRRPERLDAAAKRLADRGFDVQAIPADIREESDIVGAVEKHRERFGRLDVLVNNAGLGIWGPIDQLSTGQVDLQLTVDLRSAILFYRAALDLLRTTGAEHANSLVVNVSSVSGKAGTESLAVYSAAKHGLVGLTQSMNRELFALGIKSTVFCPGFVNTELSDYMKEEIPGDEMISTADIAEMLRALLKLSRWCVVPEIVFLRPGDVVVT